MAATRSITHDNDVYITTFFGGEEKGRCFTITANKDGLRIEKTFTEEELISILCEGGLASQDDGSRPEFDI